MNEKLTSIVQMRDKEGEPDRNLLSMWGFRSICVAEKMYLDELQPLLSRSLEAGCPADWLASIEWNHEPEFLPVPAPEELMEYMVSNTYKDIFISFGSSGVLWHPPEDYYVLSFAPSVFDAAIGDPAAVRARFDEWLGEWHHTDQGRAYLRALREKYET